MTELSALAMEYLEGGRGFTLAVDETDAAGLAAMDELVRAGLAVEVGEHMGENEELGAAGFAVSTLYNLTEAGRRARVA